MKKQPFFALKHMMMDAATTGRLSITYYNEFYPSDFFQRIKRWYESFCWYGIRFDAKKKPYYALVCPTCDTLVNCAYGTQQGDFIRTSDKLFCGQFQRIIQCMTSAQPIPYDIVRCLVERASMPLVYSKGNYERLLTTACAAVRKYRNDKRGKEVWTMALDRQCSDRSYLFGRLLAVCEKAERSAYADGSGETRETNAMRYQSVFVQKPMRTWGILEKALNYSYARLKAGSAMFYKNEISEIVNILSECKSEELNRPLADSYLLGYYLERMELNSYSKSNDSRKGNNNE